MKTSKLIYGTLLCLLVAASSCSPKKDSGKQIRLNDIQTIGSHNSYKQRIDRPLWEMIYQQDSALAISLDYNHIPIVDQLKLGLRSLELDVFHDPAGGRYANPIGLQLQQAQGITPPAFDTDNRLKEPGLKMFHIQDIDFRSHHVLFKDALEALKTWSASNPNHMPVIITMNTKSQVIDQPGFTKPLPFTKTALDSIDMEITDVLGNDMLITPDMVRGDSKTLENAILTKGWPKLKKMQGRFMFILDETGQKLADYIQGHESLKGRVMFVRAPVGTPEAAVHILNDPIGSQQEIKSLVQKGYIVRTRADEGSMEARNNDYSRLNAAISSGAQVISTDYYIPDETLGTTYKAVLNDKGEYFRIK
ncbi:hypothetical protein EYV94_21025 [Puteibacter caeruleilacunae]|nr:hypothetical protein EYV94_21025 [Puteibacter caeruleilacunae]